jgi:hypothetical protein
VYPAVQEVKIKKCMGREDDSPPPGIEVKKFLELYLHTLQCFIVSTGIARVRLKLKETRNKQNSGFLCLWV